MKPLESWQTYAEIRVQPRVWREWAGRWLSELPHVISALHDQADSGTTAETWFCGAGSSSYIGETIAPYLNSHSTQRRQHHRFIALPTTDLVATPSLYLKRGVPSLVVSFGRSGESFESIASLRLLSEHAPASRMLNITCNPHSTLANPQGELAARTQVLCLPKDANDQGFAMTASVTCMLLTALACFDNSSPLKAQVERVMALASAAETIQISALEFFDKLPTPKRCTFLGSGALTGTARESALKVLELSAGKIATQWDSCLGFRHGPKCFIDDGSIVLIYLSADPYTRAYEIDLLVELRRLYPEARIIAVGASGLGVTPDLSLGDITWAANDSAISRDAWSAVLYVQYAQIAALIWSHRMKMNIDNPFAGDNRLSRVVADVAWHPYSGTG